MVFAVSQETFNDAVKENINEFGMTPEEAVKNAVEQFVAQVNTFYLLYYKAILTISLYCKQSKNNSKLQLKENKMQNIAS